MLENVIEKFFDDNGLPYALYVPQGAWDAYQFVNNVECFDVDSYCALIVAGGDSTIHEVVNGLMHRSDGKKLPIGLLPVESGPGADHDISYGLRIDNIKQGLAYILKGQVVGMDVTKVTLDSGSVCYSLLNSSLGLGAHAAKLGIRKGAYPPQTLLEPEKLDVDIDAGDTVHEELETALMFISNSKFGGGRMCWNPLGIINDGHFEIIFSPLEFTT